ncbi:MAG: hypothetical protein R3E79_23595 [Caldilineaceae bacterium]
MKQQITLGLTSILLVALLLGACSSGMTDDEKEIAIAVALTQTAAAPASALPTALPTVAETAPTTTIVQVAPAGDAPALPMETAPSTPTLAATPAQAAEPAATVQAAVAPPAVVPGSTEPLPETQPAAKVRNLLVAPGEPGPSTPC